MNIEFEGGLKGELDTSWSAPGYSDNMIISYHFLSLVLLVVLFYV